MQNQSFPDRTSTTTHPVELAKGDSSLMSAFNQIVNIMPGTADLLLPELLSAMRQHLDLEIGFISKFNNGQREFLYVSSGIDDAPISVGDSDPLEATYCMRIAQRSIPGFIPDAMNSSELKQLEVTKRLGIRTYAGVPIFRKGGSIFGTLCCYSSTPNEALDEKSLAFMSVIADLIGTILEREQGEKKHRRQQRERIRQIIKSDSLRTVWQPIIDTRNGQFVGIESLARVNTQPYYPPNIWFDMAANAGLSSELECQSLAKGLAILPDLPLDAYVACNVSGETLISAQVQQLLQDRDLSRVVLEITEHDIIDDYFHVLQALEPLRARGLRLAIDDFGNGHSSFQHVVQLEPDFIKLDLSLVRSIDVCPNAQKVLHALVGFASNSGSKLVAEGVETEAELATLKKLGIYRVQGYLMHRPLGRSALLEAIHNSAKAIPQTTEDGE